ncbi:MAG: ROK family protein [Bacteroidota bacterium]
MLLGFDIGGTKCAVIIGKKKSTEEIEIIDKVMVPTKSPASEMLELLFNTAEEILKKNTIPIDQLRGIGINCGGPLNSKAGVILSPPNLPGWDNIPIVKMMESRFGVNAFLQNDANAGAVAELKYGAGKGYNNLIFLTFGTGMGAGLILNGQLYSGTNDLAGEVGHLRLNNFGPVGFGKSGSFEGFCSGGGIAQLAQMKVREKLQMGLEVPYCPGLGDLEKLTAKTVAEQARLGDPVAIDVYETCGYYLGKGLALLIDILNPELIILGSMYARTKDLLDSAMWRAIEEEAIVTSKNSCKIVPAGLGEQIGDLSALSLAEQIAAKS